MSLEQVFLRPSSVIWMHLNFDKSPCPHIWESNSLQFACGDSTRRSSHGSKLLLFDNYWDHCAPGIALSFRYYFSPYSWSMPHHNLITEVNRELLEGPYIHWCVTFLYNTQSLHFPLDGLKSTSGWIPKITQEKLMHLTSLEPWQIVWILYDFIEFNFMFWSILKGKINVFMLLWWVIEEIDGEKGNTIYFVHAVQLQN